MLHNEINKHIAAAMKSRDADRLYVLKMIKAKFLEFQTSKGFNEADFNPEDGEIVERGSRTLRQGRTRHQRTKEPTWHSTRVPAQGTRNWRHRRYDQGLRHRATDEEHARHPRPRTGTMPRRQRQTSERSTQATAITQVLSND